MAFCNNCGHSNPDDAKFCSGCGTELITVLTHTKESTKNETDDAFHSYIPNIEPETKCVQNKSMRNIILRVIEILIATIILFCGSMLAFIEESILCGFVIIAIGIFMYVLALRDGPRSKHPTNISGRKRLTVILLCIISSFTLLAVDISDANDENTTSVTSTTENKTTSPEAESTTSVADFKETCTKIEYEKLARNPNKFKNENLYFKGEVIQCGKSFGTKYYARVNVTLNSYGLYEDTIYVTFNIDDGQDKILEGDIVKLYGICQGEESYTSIFGEQITIPSLDALYVELVK